VTFTLTPGPVPSETDIHRSVAKALNALLLPPAFWFTYPAGLVELSPQQASRYVACGLKAGMPDIMIFHRGVYLLELKRPGGRLSRTQIKKSKHGLREVVGQVERFEELCKTGAVRDLAVCCSVDEVLHQLDKWQLPMRRIAA
jgi:hypothetical protein